MARRAQITLSDRQYAQLKHRSEVTGLRLVELVRRAVATAYGLPAEGAWTAVLERTAGSWRGREDGSTYVKRFRLGLAARLRS